MALDHHPAYVGTTKVFVTSPRYPLQEISLINVQVSIFENLMSPYITAQLTIIDSANASNAVHFQGQERVIIVILDKDENPIFNKEFICMGVEGGQKLGDDKSGYVVKLIEEHAMLSNLTRFSKVYEGKPDSICNTVCSEQLGVSVAVRGGTSQKNMRVIFPYTITPLEAANWMAARCTNSSGHPFMFYSTLVDNELQLVDLNILLAQGAFNAGDPYIFSMNAAPPPGGTDSLSVLRKKILNYSINNNEDTLLAMTRKVYGSQMVWIDTFEESATEVTYDFTEPFNALAKPNGATVYNYDPAFSVGRPYHKGQNEFSSQIVTWNLFEDGIYSYAEVHQSDEQKKKAQSRGIYHFLDQQPIDVTLNGVDFGFDKLGKQVELYIPKDIPAEENVSPESVKDKKRSGVYLIQKVRYNIFDNRFTSTVTGTKTSTLGSLGGEQLNKA